MSCRRDNTPLFSESPPRLQQVLRAGLVHALERKPATLVQCVDESDDEDQVKDCYTATKDLDAPFEFLCESTGTKSIDPAERTVAVRANMTFTSVMHDYNVRKYNCATLVRHVLGTFGVNCVWRSTKWAFTFDQPSCSASAKDFKVGLEESEAVIKLYDTTPRVTSVDELVDWSARIEDVYVMRNFKFMSGSYHVGILCTTTDANGEPRCISFSGWPYDTINSMWKLGMLFNGRFTVAFPDPGMAADGPGKHVGMRALVKIPGGVMYDAAPIDKRALKTLGYSMLHSRLVSPMFDRNDFKTHRRQCGIGKWMEAVIAAFLETSDWVRS